MYNQISNVKKKNKNTTFISITRTCHLQYNPCKNYQKINFPGGDSERKSAANRKIPKFW